MGKKGWEVSLLLAVLLTIYPSTADPAYGLLRTYVFYKTSFSGAIDIEVDDGGIYVVGYTASDRGPQSSLTILEPNHSHRCSTMIEFPVDPSFVFGAATAVEANRTHVLVAGIYLTSRLGAIAVYVAAFLKSDCKLTGVYRFYVTDYEEIVPWPFLYGEGVDLAVDESGIYLLVGLFMPENWGFLVMRLDQYLQPGPYDFYNINDPRTDFALSIALGDTSVYVAGVTDFNQLGRNEGLNVFILELDKTSLTSSNVTLIQPIEEYFPNLEIVVDENNDIYVIQTFQKYMANDAIVVDKFDRRMNNLWRQAYAVLNVYMDPSSSPPEHVPESFTFGVSAAVSRSQLFIVGYITNDYIGSGNENPVHGLLLAVNRGDGEALFGFRIRAQKSPDSNVLGTGVDTYGDCVYLAGASANYRLEYVFLDVFNVTFPLLASQGGSNPLGLKPDERFDSFTETSWDPEFDQDLGAEQYAFYGVFCPGSFIVATTTTSTITSTTTVTSETTITSTSTSTATGTSIITSTSTATSTSISTSTTTLTTTRISRYTETTTSTEIVRQTATVPSTVYTTQTQYSTVTVAQTLFETVRTIVTDRFQAPQIITVYDGAGATTATVFRNTTTTATLQLTTTVRGEVNWLELPPWFYLPFFLLPLPLVAVLLNNRRVKIIINRSKGPLKVWSHGDEPLVEDIYMTPSIVSVKEGAKITFVNKDNVPHVIEAYEGPAEYLFTSEEIKPGGKWRHKLEAPGIYRVRSITKPYMGCIIRVED